MRLTTLRSWAIMDEAAFAQGGQHKLTDRANLVPLSTWQR